MGGGVILAIAVVLWLVYLVPSWISRHQFNATERNAVRLNQALRILARTSETPDELDLELDARTAYEQTKLARRIEAERVRAEKERVREEAEHARALEKIAADSERETARIAAERERESARAQAELDKEQARIAALAEHQELARRRAELAERRRVAAEAVATERAARARRRMRLVAAIALMIGLVGIGTGVWLATTAVTAWVLVAGTALTLAGFMLLQRISTVSRRAARRPVVVEAVDVEAPRQRVAMFHDEPAPRWTPRELPQPLTSLAGSSARAAVDQNDARVALRRAALAEAMRQRADEEAPVSIETARRPQQPAAAPLRRIGSSDEEIEAHVRDLLARRAVG